MTKEKDYVLGINDYELERLRFQHGVWKEVTDNFFDRLKIKQGWKILDVGAGPGFATMDLRKLAGDSGEITALEPSEMYLDYLKNECSVNNISNIKFVSGSVETAELPENYFNLVFVRWVIGFVPEPEMFIKKLTASLAKGGIIAIQDYSYEGLALYPRGGAFEKAADAVRAYWRHGGGDPYIAVRLPKMFKDNNLELIDYKPNCLAGNPSSGVYEWAHRFFSVHAQQMADIGVISQEDSDALLEDWLEHRKNPDALFFSPTVVDAAGKK